MDSKEVSTKRLEILRNAMLINYLTEMDFNSEEERSSAYETLLFKTIIEGKFDDIFMSEELVGLDREERQRILDLSRKYNSLCFYRGNIDYWLDSVEGATLDEVDGITSILLRNYNYLIRLAKNGGEKVLNFLNRFTSNETFKDGSIIALLLLRFCDENTLEKVLIEMVSEDGLYKNFNDTQKIIMCDSPDGVLYKDNDNGEVELISIEDEIIMMHTGDNNYPVKDIDSKTFKEYVDDIYTDYNKGKVVYKK